MSQQWMSIVEFARANNVSDMTVRRRIKNGKLSAVLRDGKYFIATSESGVAPTRTTHQVKRPESTIQYSESFTEVPTVRATPRVEKTIKRPRVTQAAGSNEMVVDAENMMRMCQSIMSKMDDYKRSLQSQFASQVKELQAENNRKDIEIRELSQKVEDLQTLVNVIDGKS